MDILTEIEDRLSVFKNFYDAIRVIDPIKKKVINVNSKEDNMNLLNHSCYKFWEKGESCSNCISLRAMFENDTFVKIEERGGKIFIVTASPVNIGNATHIVELIKDVTDKGIDTHSDKKFMHNIGNLIFKLNQSAIKDSLTGAFNRRYIMEQLAIIANNNSFKNFPVCIVMIDIDYFKSINDNYGHIVGDHILKKFGNLVKESIGERAYWVGRYGGDEFILVLKNSEERDALTICSKIKKELENSEFIYKDIKIKVTASFGICSIEEDYSMSLDDMINCADKALYMAKKSGRNRICTDNYKENNDRE
ncbi:MAG: GGDEF domain-containing protein [Clostridiaceae bacterium]